MRAPVLKAVYSIHASPTKPIPSQNFYVFVSFGVNKLRCEVESPEVAFTFAQALGTSYSISLFISTQNLDECHDAWFHQLRVDPIRIGVVQNQSLLFQSFRGCRLPCVEVRSFQMKRLSRCRRRWDSVPVWDGDSMVAPDVVPWSLK